MKVLLINGSPHKEGCTYTALAEAAAELNSQGIETEIIHIGNDPVRGCIACGGCAGKGCCVFDDIVNEVIEKARTADGFLVGSPVYYASPNGSLISFLDRLFYAGGSAFAYKPAAAITSARRAGTTASFEVINKYFTMEIDCEDGVNYDINVFWGSSSATARYWHFTGTYDETQAGIVYTGIQFYGTTLSDGTVERSEETENEAGLIRLEDGVLYWEDATGRHVEDEMDFNRER